MFQYLKIKMNCRVKTNDCRWLSYFSLMSYMLVVSELSAAGARLPGPVEKPMGKLMQTYFILHHKCMNSLSWSVSSSDQQ